MGASSAKASRCDVCVHLLVQRCCRTSVSPPPFLWLRPALLFCFSGRTERVRRADGRSLPITLTSLAGRTPHRGLYGRGRPGVAEFELTRDAHLDDADRDVPTLARHDHRVPETLIAAIAHGTAQQQHQRTLQSKTTAPGEDLPLEPSDLPELW